MNGLLALRAAPLLILCLTVGCATSARAPGSISCGVPHCALIMAPGLRTEETDGTLAIVHDPTGARVDVEQFGTRRREDVDVFLDAERRALALAATWGQPLAETHGFEVRGVTGQTPPPPGVFLDTDPEKLWLATYRNPATGSVLVLRARAAASVWDEAWAVLAPVLTRVVLTEDF